MNALQILVIYTFLFRPKDSPVRKKIRVVQFGVGPIGASIVRLDARRNRRSKSSAQSTATPRRLATISANSSVRKTLRGESLFPPKLPKRSRNPSMSLFTQLHRIS